MKHIWFEFEERMFDLSKVVEIRKSSASYSVQLFYSGNEDDYLIMMCKNGDEQEDLFRRIKKTIGY